MSQQFQVIDPSIPSGDTGTTFAGKMNDWRGSLLSLHSGTTRPSYSQAGTIWRDTTASPWVVKMYDGSDDIPLYDVNPTTHLVTKIYVVSATAAQILAGTEIGAFIDPAGLQTRMSSVAQYRARTAGYILQSSVAFAALAEVVITDAGTLIIDLSTMINGRVTLGGTRTVALPTNAAEGMCGRLRVIQGGAGNHSLNWATGWQFSGGIPPVLSTAAGSVDLLYYDVLPGGDVFVSPANNVRRP